MRILHHAAVRYLQRVCGGQPSAEAGDVRIAILEMWRTSYTATPVDLRQARFRRRDGDVCRVTEVGDKQFLMIARQDVIVTILDIW